MSSDTAAVPEPVSATGWTGPMGPTGPTGPVQVDAASKVAEEIAGMYNVMDWKKPVPTALAVFAHVSTMTALTGEERLRAVQQVLVAVARRAGTSADESSAIFFVNEVLPHIVHAVETVASGKTPAVEAVKDFAQKEMKGIAPIVLPEIQKVSGWCCR